MIANSQKWKWKGPILFWFPPQIFLKNSSPNHFFWNFVLSIKKEIGGRRKLMCFYRKIYVILVNSFCVFLLEHIDVFWMFLLLPAIKNKTKDRKSVTSSNWVRLRNPWKLSNQKDLQDSSVYGNSKFWGGLTWLIIHFKMHIKIIHFFSLIFLQGCLPSMCVYS